MAFIANQVLSGKYYPVAISELSADISVYTLREKTLAKAFLMLYNIFNLKEVYFKHRMLFLGVLISLLSFIAKD